MTARGWSVRADARSNEHEIVLTGHGATGGLVPSINFTLRQTRTQRILRIEASLVEAEELVKVLTGRIQSARELSK